MSEVVWVSAAMTDSTLTKPLTSDLAEENMNLAVQCGERNNSGDSLLRSEFPNQIFPVDFEDYVIRKLPHLFFAGSFWVVSKQVAEVLRQFDLGDGGLYPVKVYQKDRKTEFCEGWHCLNFGNVKEAFLPDMSPRTKDFPQGRKAMPFVPEDGDVAISSSALDGPDIWVDPLLFKTFFMSGRLQKALKEENVSEAFRLYRCRVVVDGKGDE